MSAFCESLYWIGLACQLLLVCPTSAQRRPPPGGPAALVYVCPACNAACDTLAYPAPGTCPACQMALVLRPQTNVPPRRAAQYLRTARRLPRSVRHQLDTLFQAAVGPEPAPGYAVGIFCQGRVLFSHGYGQANLEYTLPNTPETVFNVASLSKQFTAACIALLVQQGRLSLDDEVRRYVPAVGQYPERLLIKHLIYMTSGLPEYHAQPRGNGLNWNLYDYFTVDTAIAATLRQPRLLFPPGTQWAYSNVNYMLLTKIVEQVSGQRFADFAQQQLFAPLGMAHTLVNDDVTQVVPNRATGYVPRTPALVAASRQAGFYVREGGEFVQVHRNAPHYGGSGVFTSVEDWFRWDRNWTTHQVGGESFYQLLHRRERFAHPKDNDALGLVFGSFHGSETVWYAGGDVGFTSYVVRFPHQQLTVVCFSNNNDGKAEAVTQRVLEVLRAAGVLRTPQ